MYSMAEASGARSLWVSTIKVTATTERKRMRATPAMPVGGKIVESRGILKHWTEANRDEALGLNYWALQCINEHEYLANSRHEPCKECGQPSQGQAQALMFPRFGYTTAAWDPPKPPGRSLDRVGEVILSTAGGFNLNAATQTDPNFGGIPALVAIYYEAGAGELLLRNAGGDPWSTTGSGFALLEVGLHCALAAVSP